MLQILGQNWWNLQQIGVLGLDSWTFSNALNSLRYAIFLSTLLQLGISRLTQIILWNNDHNCKRKLDIIFSDLLKLFSQTCCAMTVTVHWAYWLYVLIEFYTNRRMSHNSLSWQIIIGQKSAWIYIFLYFRPDSSIRESICNMLCQAWCKYSGGEIQSLINFWHRSVCSWWRQECGSILWNEVIEIELEASNAMHRIFNPVRICLQGSLVRAFRRIEEVLRQLVSGAKMIGDMVLAEKFETAMESIKHGVVFAGSLYLWASHAILKVFHIVTKKADFVLESSFSFCPH